MKKLALVMLGVLAVGADAEAGWWRRARCCDPYVSQCIPSPCCASAPVAVTAQCAPAPCAPPMVEQTVWDPVLTTETRKIQVTEYREEPRVRKFNVTRLVPRTEMKSRTVCYTELEPRTREEKYVECRTVEEVVDQPYTVMVPYCETRTGTRCIMTPVVSNVQKTYTVMVPYCETRRGTRCVMRPNIRNVEQPYLVSIPYTEQRTGTRTVWECVPTVQTRTVCEDQGHWEQRCTPVSNGCQPYGVVANCCRPSLNYACCGCDPCATCCVPTVCVQNVWVPKIVQREIQCTVYTNQCRQVPYNYSVTLCRQEQRSRTVQVCEMVPTQVEFEYQVQLCRPEQRTCTVQVCNLVPSTEKYEYQVQLCRPENRIRKVTCCRLIPEEKTRIVNYCVPVTKTREEQYPVTICDTICEEKSENYTVCVPYCVEREIQVQVCRSVPRKVLVPACPQVAPCCQ